MWGKFAQSQAKSQVTESLYEVKSCARTQQTTELMQVNCLGSGLAMVYVEPYSKFRHVNLDFMYAIFKGNKEHRRLSTPQTRKVNPQNLYPELLILRRISKPCKLKPKTFKFEQTTKL